MNSIFCSCFKKRKPFNFWDESEKVKFRSKLKKMNEKPLYTTKGNLKCIMCLGESCKAESYNNNMKTAIPGLNSSFISQTIIASQRPSTAVIGSMNLLYEFKKLNISTIINLQNEGEHPYCGPNMGLECSGFTYYPEVFMSELIDVHLERWKNLAEPESISWMLSIMTKIHKVITSEKSVFVHCHSGNKRSCLVIGCYFIYTTDLPCNDIIAILKAKRPTCNLGKKECDFLDAFKEYIDYSKIIFTGEKHQVWYFLKKQNNLPSEKLEQQVMWMPKLLVTLMQRIIKVKEIFNYDNMKVYLTLSTAGLEDYQHEDKVVKMKKLINLGMWEIIENESDLDILTILMIDWLEDCVTYIIDKARLSLLFLCQEISGYLETFKNSPDKSSKFERKQVFNQAKLVLSNTEIEALLCFSQFLAVIPPGRINMSEIKEYFKMQSRISSLLMGIKQVNNSKGQAFQTEEVKIAESVDLQSKLSYFDQKSCSQLNTLIEIFVLIISTDILTNDEFFNTVTDQHSKLTLIENQACNLSSNTTIKSDNQMIKVKGKKKHHHKKLFKKQENFKENMSILQRFSKYKIEEIAKIKKLIDSYLKHNPSIELTSVPDCQLFEHEKLNPYKNCCQDEFYNSLEQILQNFTQSKPGSKPLIKVTTSIKTQKISTKSVQMSSKRLKKSNSIKKVESSDSSSFTSSSSEENRVVKNGMESNRQHSIREIESAQNINLLDSNANLLMGQPRRRSILFKLNNKGELIRPKPSLQKEVKEASHAPAFNSLQSTNKSNFHIISPKKLLMLINESDNLNKDQYPHASTVKMLVNNLKSSHDKESSQRVNEPKTIKFDQRLDNIVKQKRSSVLSDAINSSVKPKQRSQMRFSIDNQ